MIPEIPAIGFIIAEQDIQPLRARGIDLGMLISNQLICAYRFVIRRQGVEEPIYEIRLQRDVSVMEHHHYRPVGMGPRHLGAERIEAIEAGRKVG